MGIVPLTNQLENPFCGYLMVVFLSFFICFSLPISCNGSIHRNVFSGLLYSYQFDGFFYPPFFVVLFIPFTFLVVSFNMIVISVLSITPTCFQWFCSLCWSLWLHPCFGFSSGLSTMLNLGGLCFSHLIHPFYVVWFSVHFG